ncbi:MAG: hypothetical protein ACKPKO_35155, partial [Candidatus Fonsibacter sp.]
MNPDDLRTSLSLRSAPEPPTRLMMCTLVSRRLRNHHGNPVLRAWAETAPFRVSDITYAHQDTGDVD